MSWAALLRVEETPTFGFWDRIIVLSRTLEPKRDRFLRVRQCFCVRRTVRHAARQLRNVGDE
jgi:hypothetical protein